MATRINVIPLLDRPVVVSGGFGFYFRREKRQEKPTGKQMYDVRANAQRTLGARRPSVGRKVGANATEEMPTGRRMYERTLDEHWAREGG